MLFTNIFSSIKLRWELYRAERESQKQFLENRRSRFDEEDFVDSMVRAVRVDPRELAPFLEQIEETMAELLSLIAKQQNFNLAIQPKHWKFAVPLESKITQINALSISVEEKQEYIRVCREYALILSGVFPCAAFPRLRRLIHINFGTVISATFGGPRFGR